LTQENTGDRRISGIMWVREKPFFYTPDGLRDFMAQAVRAGSAADRRNICPGG